jgi:hypothetical protein
MNRNSANATLPTRASINDTDPIIASVTQSHRMSRSDGGNYKKPFVALMRLNGLPLIDPSPASRLRSGESNPAEPSLRPLTLPPLWLPIRSGKASPPRALPRSRRRPFHPSSSRSSLSARSRSSRSSRSARFAANWLVESLIWSSSIVERRPEILSRAFPRSSEMAVFCFSRRSI